MKTVLKRLLSFVLVAMMLVSVMPFQASAEEDNITVEVWIQNGAKQTTISLPREGASVSSVLQAAASKLGEGYDAQRAVLYKDGESSWEPVANIEDDVDQYYANFEPVWVINVSGDKGSWTDKYTASEKPGREDWIEDKLGTEADFYDVEWNPSDDNKTVNVNITAKSCTIQFEIKVNDTVMSGVGNVTKKYKESYTLNVSNWFKEDPKLYTIGSWEINGQQVANGSAWTVNTTGTVTAKIEINSNGYQRSNLWAKNSAGEWVHEGYLYWKSGEAIEGWKTAPTIGTTTGFVKWNSQQNGKGIDLPGGNLGATEILLPDYYAQYETDYNNGNAEVRVTAVYFVDGIEHHRSSDYVLTLEVPAGTNVMTSTWLNSAGNKQKIEEGIEAFSKNIDKYTWDGGFYNSSFSTSYASTGLKANGNTNVYVKVDADKKEIEDVYLYIHKNTTSKDPAQIITLKGYVGGDKVTLSDAKDAAKKADWRADSYKIYSDNDWKQLMADGDPDGNGEEVAVNDGTSTIVHILLKNGYKTSGTADKSNYKTGDTVMIAVTALGLSASALVVLYLVSKKKRAL